MKAVVFESPKKINIKEIEEPEIGEEDVFIRVKAAGLCGTDLHIYNGDFIAKYPVVAGHEFCGEIVKTGNKVTGLSAGDRVSVDPCIYCGKCDFCRTRHENFCRDFKAYGLHFNGGFEEFVCVNHRNVYSIGNLSFEEGAMVEPLSCVVHGINRIGLEKGYEVLIFGAGPIGLLLMQVCKRSGASKVLMIDIANKKLERAKQMGADGAFLNDKDLRSNVKKFYPSGADVVIDATGIPEVVQSMPEYVKDAGKLLFFGVCPQDSSISINPYNVYKRELTIYGSFSLLHDFPSAIKLLQSGAIDVKSLVSHQFSLDDFMKGFNLMLGAGEFIKILIKL